MSAVRVRHRPPAFAPAALRLASRSGAGAKAARRSPQGEDGLSLRGKPGESPIPDKAHEIRRGLRRFGWQAEAERGRRLSVEVRRAKTGFPRGKPGEPPIPDKAHEIRRGLRRFGWQAEAERGRRLPVEARRAKTQARALWRRERQRNPRPIQSPRRRG